MTTGAGLSTAGTSPAGLGTPTANTQLVGSGYQVSEGGCVSSVLIEYGTKDYVFDDYGNEKPMSDAAQRVYILISTSVNSRTGWPDFGLKPPKYINGNMQRDVERRVRTALKPVLDDGTITVDAVEVETEGNKVVCVVRWTDRRRQESRDTRVPLSQ